ncbi:autotransporter domain-containing protein [Exilibacterium tricleocarpae]|uniref:Autotransporter domain-containing protein n=1 Tax=Exilibacterium tricleocarpae TaxID=2591008 RepID=A0A545SQJ8_9GAMM|nr:autotransporter domain-containing protein [Exilibacterium tricleocarpae]TQV67239.1 autotransporter domain-containing protein [Exilibacterium tricleocarpae]
MELPTFSVASFSSVFAPLSRPPLSHLPLLRRALSSRCKGVAGVLLCSLAVPVYAVAPQAVDDVRSIPIDSSITLNLIANDFDADGDIISIQSIGQPANGSAVLNADGSVLYTAAPGFSGVDTFVYVLQDDSDEGLTSQGTVRIAVSDGRFEGFAGNTNDRSLAQALSSVCNRLRELDDGQLGSSQRQLLNQCVNLEVLAVGSPEAIAGALNQIAPEETLSQMRVAVDSTHAHTNAVTQRVQQVKSAGLGASIPGLVVNGKDLSNDLALGGGASADRATDGSIWSRLGLFASVQVEDAERDKTRRENGYQADTNTLTVGSDYFLSESLLVGLSLGISDGELEYESSDGELDSEITTLIAFGAYFYQDFSFFLQAGYSQMDFDSMRLIRYGSGDLAVDERAVGSTTGIQRTLNTRAEWQWQKDELTLTPFVRMDYLESDIKAYSERGGGGLAMDLSQQATSQLTLAAGLQGAYVLNQSWGVLVPTASFTYLSETDSDRDPVAGRFAFDTDTSNRFMLNNDGGDTAFYQVSVGASAVFKHGWSGFLEYRETLGYEDLSVSQFQIGVRYEL